MAGQRILLKLATSAGPAMAPVEATFKTAGSLKLTRLFDAAAPSAGPGLAATARHVWYVAESTSGQGFGAASAHPWDIAHDAIRGGIGLTEAQLLAAEPDLEQSPIFPRQLAQEPGPGAAPAPVTAEGQKGAPFDIGSAFGWHLDPDHSGLRAARAAVGAAGSKVTIVHLDTGYDPNHLALPRNLAPRERQRNFVENNGSAADQTPAGGLLTNRGHGTGTIGILAGGAVSGLTAAMPIPPGFGDLGGAPEAQIVPVRIADSVVKFWTSTVAQGIDYAREIGADVLSMSMGGLPSQAWADAVNAAYDAGVVLVCAAGNSFGGLPTSLIVYPARFGRVIAACGVMAQYHPYYGLGGPMEGNVGPLSKMATAIAAYTPNIPWLRLGARNIVDMDGAGTSAATPQVAAAAALWLAKHYDDPRYPKGSWQRVEAVRAALFSRAGHRGQNDPVPDRFFGRGLLRADLALDFTPDVADLTRTEPDSASFAFLHLLSSVFGLQSGDQRLLEMYRLEATQLALNSRAAREAVADPNLPPDQIPERMRRTFFEAILGETTGSAALRGYLGTLLGRGVVAGGPGPGSVPTGAAGPAVTVPTDPFATKQGPRPGRALALPPPSRRRLRVFATDPGDSGRLITSFVNLATVAVPWEELKPGPTGEYLEVVDVDPATDAAYDPVDLDSRELLAQDGIAPSEGNPQFHQQMVYAVAMRTIRSFEIALGRRALWAERHMTRNGHFIPAPDGGYVQRLRIYPHALREKNAYYSPDRKALLFGYFGDDAQSGGRRTIFTCLSHDVVAHETTHALLDGLHRRYQEQTNPDVLAFHEAFADIVAIFQHFTFPELLRAELSRVHGDLWQESILSDLARQFGQSLHNQRALRRALDPEHKPDDPEEALKPLRLYSDATEPHERGAILVAAVFEAFVSIYQRRTRDLFRLASGGSGTVIGSLHPDLVNRLATEAVDTAQRILTICIRALDYMPPIDPTFGDYLRAVITSDADLSPDRGMGYRVALAEAFNKRGIYPDSISSVAPDSLLWQTPDGRVQSSRLNDFLRTLDLGTYSQSDRRRAFDSAKKNAAELHEWLIHNLDVEMAIDIGLDFRAPPGERPRFEVHSVRPALRATEDGEPRTDVVAVITQRVELPVDPAKPDGPKWTLRGGCTLILDRGYDTPPIRYAITKPIWNGYRADSIRDFQSGRSFGMNALYGEDDATAAQEPFAALHSGLSVRRATPPAPPPERPKARPAAAAARAPRGGGGVAGASIRVRMYRLGLGDCFLVSLLRPAAKPFHMMIDCGLILGTQDDVDKLTKGVSSIIKETGGEVDVLVVTHEHYDHVSGFVRVKDLFATPDDTETEGKLKIGEVWFAWTEDPDNADAARIRKDRAERVSKLSALASRLDGMAIGDAASPGEFGKIEGALSFFGIDAAGLDAMGAAAGSGKSLGATAQAMVNAHSFVPDGKVFYRNPGEIWTSDGAPGLRIYFLGPPDDDASLKKTDSSTEVYHLDNDELDGSVLWAASEGQSYPDWDPFAPFDSAWAHKLSDLVASKRTGQLADFIADHYAGPANATPEADKSWRRIDGAWLASAEQLALALDNATNNTSLAFAIELVDTGKVLVFPADAQVGNLLSWHSVKWPDSDETATSLLQRAVFYKVGHHGSHNATLKEQELELMPEAGLTAFIPVDHAMAVKKHWGQMPLPALIDALNERTSGHVVRIDEDLADGTPGVTGGGEDGPYDTLYYEWTMLL